MTSLEAKREQFRKYLERSGVIDALSKALIKLYEETNKPDDAVRFIRKHLCDSCPNDEAFDILKADLREANKTIFGLEEELNRVKGNIKRTHSEVLKLVKDGMRRLEDERSGSPVRKYLTNTVFEELKDLKSFFGSTLADCLNATFENPHELKIGVYVGDHDCYAVFDKLLDPIIHEYHGIGEEDEIKQPNCDWGDATTLTNIDPEGKYIKSTKIRVSRNLAEYPFFPKLTERDFTDIMDKISKALMCLEGEYDGVFYPLAKIDTESKKDLAKSHIIFEKNNKLLEDAGGYRFWPTGRGVYYNAPHTFAAWINEEDHLQIISMSQTASLPDVYRRLMNALPTIEKDLKFRQDEKLGYVTTSPTNLGSTLRASVHIHLPKLTADMDMFRKICKDLGLEVRVRDDPEPVVEVANSKKLGVTQIEAVKIFQDGVLNLISQETAK